MQQTKNGRRNDRRSFGLFLLLPLTWLNTQASMTGRNNGRHDGETMIKSFWHDADGGIPSLNVVYTGNHSSARYLSTKHAEYTPKRRYLVEEIEDQVSKYGLRPSSSSSNAIEGDDFIVTPPANDAITITRASASSSEPPDSDDDFVRLSMQYDHSHIKEATTNSHKSIRIKFITDPIEERIGEGALLDAKIDELLTKALPEAARIWKQHLSVYPVSGGIDLTPDVCYGSYAHLWDDNGSSKEVRDADMVIFISAYDVLSTPSGGTIPVCGPRSLALGAACALDQWDRPVVGFINLCLDDGDDEDELQLDELVSQAFQQGTDYGRQTSHQHNSGKRLDSKRASLTDILLHEIAHTLGFDSYLFKFFRDAKTGEPLTPRPFQTTVVECSNGDSSSEHHGFPSSKVLQRGKHSNGDVYYEIVTPRVKQVVQNHFNCPSLTGARLENYEASCIGSHWDERLFLADILSPALEWRGNYLTPLTLALLEDTGWYKVDYTNVTAPTFGLGAGCDFINGDCIVDDKVAPYAKDYFCDHPIRLLSDQGNGNYDMDLESQNVVKCDPNHQYWAMCDLWDASTVPNFLSDRFNQGSQATQYFSDANLQVSFPQADYCPVAIEYLGVDCTQEVSDSNARVNYYSGEQAGPGSRCINAFSDISEDRNRRIDRPACMHIECDTDLQKVVLGQGIFQQVCEYDGQILQIPSSTADYLECPRASTICPHFYSPSSCSGRGVCNFHDGEDNLPRSSCQCFDPLDTSDGCYGNYGTDIAYGSFPGEEFVNTLKLTSDAQERVRFPFWLVLIWVLVAMLSLVGGR